MGVRLLIGTSRALDAEAAVREAAARALGSSSHPAMALVFATGQYDPDAVARGAAHALGAIPWVGCTTAGVFADAELLHPGIGVGVLDSSDAFVAVGMAGAVGRNPRAAGAAAVTRALDQLPSFKPGRGRALFLLVDVQGGEGAEVVRGAVHEGGTGAAWVGGGSGDNLGTTPPAQFARGRAWRDHVIAAAIDVEGTFGAGTAHGWQPWGAPTLVTRATGPVVQELEYRPAFEAYRLAAEAKGAEVDASSFPTFAISHPLGIPQADGELVIRDPLSLEADGALRCVSEVPDGSLVRVMHAAAADVVGAARQAARAARERASGPLGGAIVFDCVSRRVALGAAYDEELDAFRSELGETAVLGCLSFGEVGVLGSGLPQFHNKTAAVLALPG